MHIIMLHGIKVLAVAGERVAAAENWLATTGFTIRKVKVDKKMRKLNVVGTGSTTARRKRCILRVFITRRPA